MTRFDTACDVGSKSLPINFILESSDLTERVSEDHDPSAFSLLPPGTTNAATSDPSRRRLRFLDGLITKHLSRRRGRRG